MYWKDVQDGNEIDLDYADRVTAICVFEDDDFNLSMYASDTDHRDCCAEYLRANGTSYEELFQVSLDDDSETLWEVLKSDKLSDIRIYAFNVFECDLGSYLIANHRDDFAPCFSMMLSYATSKSLKLGYFTSSHVAIELCL